NNDACLNTCKSATCGDAIVYQGVEQCDDGNQSNNDFCSNQCVSPTCSDGVKNGTETGVDCGGSCGKCGLGGSCQSNSDCAQQACVNNVCTLTKSCKELKQVNPSLGDGDYTIDPDGAGAIQPLGVHCDMDAGACGYTMVRFNDGALGSHQDAYTNKCAAVGMEVIVPRTKAHATAIVGWNGGVVPNLYNVFPKYVGAQYITNWTGRCQGQPCTFWMTDNAQGNVSCLAPPASFEPNGDNLLNYRIYKWNEGCGIEGGWNDANASVMYTGWVICSTNDC
ncbi:fibrinogen-like YCDxxxxGGGW domain-containing protein, partial [Nannocystis pusilla]|uniref:fibrinogen-like YCDxxxxGGGW domain-containing protein n=1 Tax=Nannocystis pusilla TaxID=889268 RepID=UPI003BF14F56